MRSSDGKHWIALDQVRALAAFLVFTWHFVHGANGTPVPFAGAPVFFPLAILDEGHAGVALFMTLSGYLFAKLLDGKRIAYGAFFLNRMLRLAPLLLLVLLVVNLLRASQGAGTDVLPYLRELMAGFVSLQPLHNGIWSIVIELHFYAILPLLLTAARRDRFALLYFLAAAIAIRGALYLQGGDVQSFAYWTIMGRIDQFLLGMFVFQFRDLIRNRHLTIGSVILAFLLAYYFFDAAGGYHGLEDRPFGRALWIVWPTIEGACFAAAIAYYDSSYAPRGTGVSGFIAKAGEYSYSIYLLHFFVVFHEARFVERYVMDISNFYVACLWSAVFFAAMVPVGWLSFVCIEAPFLRMRKRYVLPARDAVPAVRPEAAKA
jgi:peptidoglycan/LPS O-acetylase OafA/YrhL